MTTITSSTKKKYHIAEERAFDEDEHIDSADKKLGEKTVDELEPKKGKQQKQKQVVLPCENRLYADRKRVLAVAIRTSSTDNAPFCQWG